MTTEIKTIFKLMKQILNTESRKKYITTWQESKYKYIHLLS